MAEKLRFMNVGGLLPVYIDIRAVVLVRVIYRSECSLAIDVGFSAGGVEHFCDGEAEKVLEALGLDAPTKMVPMPYQLEYPDGGKAFPSTEHEARDMVLAVEPAALFQEGWFIHGGMACIHIEDVSGCGPGLRQVVRVAAREALGL